MPHMTVMFCDVRGFTALSERMDAAAVFALLGGMFAAISPIISSHHGFIDKFIGDAVMALFPGSPADAAAAAVRIQQAVRSHGSGSPAAATLAVSIGVHTGGTMLGTLGDARRMDATVISDAVNLASRLEGLTRTFGSSILLSGDVLSRIGDAAALEPRYLGRARVRGKQQPIEVYELLAGEPTALRELKRAQQAAFTAAVERFQHGDLAGARAQLAALDAADGPARLYFTQCDAWLAQALPRDWCGVLEIATK